MPTKEGTLNTRTLSGLGSKGLSGTSYQTTGSNALDVNGSKFGKCRYRHKPRHLGVNDTRRVQVQRISYVDHRLITRAGQGRADKNYQKSLCLQVIISHRLEYEQTVLCLPGCLPRGEGALPLMPIVGNFRSKDSPPPLLSFPNPIDSFFHADIDPIYPLFEKFQ